MKKINVEALFLGPKSENREFFKEMLNFMMDEHIHWRRDFHPEDKPAITVNEQQGKDYLDTLERTEEALLELTNKLKVSSMPWFSPRYLGHMNSDTLMAANLGYMATMLYNPNNVAFEGSPATGPLEIEVGNQLAKMLSYNPQKSWGHITCDGTIANYESIWVARNLKSIPLAVKEVEPKLVGNMSDWQLLNLSPSRILDLVDKTKASGIFDRVRERSVRGVGMQNELLGKLLVPQSKHYSWTKAADVLGIGNNNLIDIQVDENFRMDMQHLKNTIDKLVRERTPILAVVAVVGTTEEGAVDEVHEIVKLRQKYQKQGVSFYIHVDAAYGGYARTVFLDEKGEFMSADNLKEALHKLNILHKETDWPVREVYQAYKAMPEADSITTDPHKMGYIPYAAGAVVFKDRRVLDLVSYFAAYIEEKGASDVELLGSYILEGSKAGAAASAVWVAHQVVPLNITGYGAIIGRSIEGASRFYNSLVAEKQFEIAGRRFKVEPLTKPDFNIVDFSFNEIGNTNLELMNNFNQRIYELCSYHDGPVYADDWITSKTDLSVSNYGDAPKAFAATLGISEKEWNRVQDIYVLRSCVLTPFLVKHTTYQEYWSSFMKTMKKKIIQVGELKKLGKAA
jgi:tyrosine decarboxylase